MQLAPIICLQKPSEVRPKILLEVGTAPSGTVEGVCTAVQATFAAGLTPPTHDWSMLKVRACLFNEALCSNNVGPWQTEICSKLI